MTNIIVNESQRKTQRFLSQRIILNRLTKQLKSNDAKKKKKNKHDAKYITTNNIKPKKFLGNISSNKKMLTSFFSMTITHISITLSIHQYKLHSPRQLEYINIFIIINIL